MFTVSPVLATWRAMPRISGIRISKGAFPGWCATFATPSYECHRSRKLSRGSAASRSRILIVAASRTCATSPTTRKHTSRFAACLLVQSSTVLRYDDASLMRVRFWGVRGSAPWALPDAMHYGCNTPCVELTHESGVTLVIDAGSGIVGLSESLTGDDGHISLLLSHYHWDHIQGLPFLASFYRPGWSTTVGAPELECRDEAWMTGIFKRQYFPVTFDRLPNRPRIQDVRPGSFMIDAFEVRAVALNHPGGALAYRIRGSAGDFVYASDVELGQPSSDEALSELIQGAHAVVMDAHFTPEEVVQHRGWGHSSWQQAASFAADRGVGCLWLFHHKPGRTDKELRRIQIDARQVFPATVVAAEGESFDV